MLPTTTKWSGPPPARCAASASARRPLLLLLPLLPACHAAERRLAKRQLQHLCRRAVVAPCLLAPALACGPQQLQGMEALARIHEVGWGQGQRPAAGQAGAVVGRARAQQAVAASAPDGQVRRGAGVGGPPAVSRGEESGRLGGLRPAMHACTDQRPAGAALIMGHGTPGGSCGAAPLAAP
jgi:hypothetical protein